MYTYDKGPELSMMVTGTHGHLSPGRKFLTITLCPITSSLSLECWSCMIISRISGELALLYCNFSVMSSRIIEQILIVLTSLLKKARSNICMWWYAGLSGRLKEMTLMNILHA